ncbi:Ferric uptake regulation protein [Pirellulimonas nuda]|uniref:Ferric uptake regulation protein n=1 Tax=Pirellulimonas nuda TaxID=2528009 RepID=A0A518D9N6_9BACT|nr:transcriptional repressor [Pirellulimonas nuda]QDU88148.1 Ferric uptake regulation protein [Pirellulimonas nuda]
MSSQFALNDVEVALSPQERFDEYLQSRGKRITQQRRVLVEHVFSRHEHFDADELMDALSKSTAKQAGGAQVSRATVYRGLEELVEAGLLRKMSLDGRAVYEHDYGYPQHDHLYCQQCQKLIEFQSQELTQLREEVAKEHNFRVTGHRLIVTGVCQSCATNRHRRLSPVDLI